jgi:DNA repair exonuclease SbcCD ATPase subunit
MLKGLHDFNWQRQVLRTLREIWQQTKQRDDRKELKERSDKYSESRKKAREEANRDKEKTPTKQQEETLIKRLQRQQKEIEEHEKLQQKLIEERKRTEKECVEEFKKEASRFTEMKQHLSKYHQETEKTHYEKTQRGGASQDRDSRLQENEETLEACRIKIAKTHEQFKKESKERQEKFEKFQQRKWETFRQELEKDKTKTNKEKTPEKETTKGTMIQMPKTTYKRKAIAKPIIPDEDETHTESPWIATFKYSGQGLKCLTCNRKMKDQNSLDFHLQGKEHKRIHKQVKEARATNTKRRKVRFK